MSALHDAYLKGAQRLCEETDRNSADHEAACTLYMRLEENIINMVHGDTRDNNVDRNEILSSFNRITERLLKISFREYCQLDKKQEDLRRKDEDVGRDNYPQPQNMPDILVLESAKKENTEPHAPESDLAEQAYDFLIQANEYIATLLPCAHNARKAFNKARLRPQECTDAYTSFRPFSHPCIPSHDSELFEMRVRLLSLNDQIREVTKLFQTFCLEAQKTGKHTNKTLQRLDFLLTTLQVNANSTQLFITSIVQEKSMLNKNTALDDIS